MKGKKSKLLAALLAGALLLSVTACSSADGSQTSQASEPGGSAQGGEVSKPEESSGAADPVTLTFVNWGSAEDSTKPAFDAMCEDFTKKNPNITIEQVAYPYNSIKDQLLIMSSGGNPPDVAQVKAEWVVSLYNAGVLADLNSLLSKETIDDFYGGLLAGATYDGKVCAAPWAPSPILMYYNKTLMQKAGYSEPPKTWAEMIKQAEKITALGSDENGNKIYGWGVSAKKLVGTGYFFLVNMWQNGGEFLDDSGTVVLNSEGNVKAFTEIRDMVKNGVVPEGLEIKELRNLFAQGQMGFMFDMEASFAVFNSGSPKGDEFEKEYAATFIPGITADEKGKTIAIEHQLCVFENSPNKEFAAAFVDYLTGKDGMSVYNDYVSKLPARKSVESLEYYQKEENAKLAPFMESLSFAKSLPASNENFSFAMEEIAGAIQRVTMNNEEPAAVVKDLDAAVREKYEK